MMPKMKLDSEGGRQTKPCEKRGCQELMSTPHCFLQFSPRCKRGGLTSRWHHISAGEHYCNECFDWIYRSHYPGHQLYLDWSEVWTADANTLPNVKCFVTDQHLPYWVQCHKSGCGKWRRLPLDLELFHVQLDSIQCQDCSLPEDESVAPVYSPYWISTLGYIPLLRHTLLAPLVGEYYPEGVGVSPSTVQYTCRKMAEGRKKQEQQPQQGGGVPTSTASIQSGSASQHADNTTVPNSTACTNNSTSLQTPAESSSLQEADEDNVLPKAGALLSTPASPISMQWLQNWSQLQEKSLNRLLVAVNDASMSLTAGQPPEGALVVIKSFQKQLEDVRAKFLCVCRLIESLRVPEGLEPSLEILKRSTVLLHQITQTISNPLALQKGLVEQMQLALALNITLQQQSARCPADSLPSVPPLKSPSLFGRSSGASSEGGSIVDHADPSSSRMPAESLGLGIGNGTDPSPLLIHLLASGGSGGSSGQHVADNSMVPPLKKAKLDNAVGTNDAGGEGGGRRGGEGGGGGGGRRRGGEGGGGRGGGEEEGGRGGGEEGGGRGGGGGTQLENPLWKPLHVVPAYVMNAATPSLMIRPPLMDPSTIMDSASAMEPASVMKSVTLKDPSSVIKAPPLVVPLDVNHTAHSRDTCSTSVSPPAAPKSSSSGSFHLLTLGSSSSPNLRTSPLSSPTQPLGTSAPPTFDQPPMQRVPPSTTTQGDDRLGTTTPSSTVPTPSSLGMGMGQSVGTSVEKAHNVPIAKRVTVKPADIQSVSLPAMRKTPTVPLSGLLHDPFHPFNHPDDGERAMAFTPDVMTEEEMAAFPEYSKSPVLEVYLMLRNLVLALWHRNCKSFLGVEQCFEELNTRGLVRIWCLGALRRIVHFLTQRGYINYGSLDNAPVPFPIAGNMKTYRVLVVGAGPAGIGCAKHLKHFGYQVTVLEAKAAAGGRCYDDSSLGATLSLGAMIVTGIDNNPITTLCHQMGFPLHLIVDDKCDLISENGTKPSSEMDKKVDDHFNTCLDRLAEWRSKEEDDCSLEDKLSQIHQELQKSSGHTVTEEEERLLHFHLSNLEFACGAELSQVSAQNWDHNDKFPQFNGPHATLPQGYQVLFQRLADQLDVHYRTPVTRVEVTEEGRAESCRVTDSHGEVWLADKVVVTVPLAVLRSGDIQFNPPLPARKMDALKRLGVGVIEKVIVQFPSPFWRHKMNTPHFFGHVSSSEHRRGLFPVFYDVTEKPSDTAGPFVLLSTVCGAAVNLLNDLTDEQLVGLFVSTLKTLFPDLDVPAPTGHLVSHWRSDPYARMSYSYAAVGSSGKDYQVMAESCHLKLHFAGEGTNELYPQTVTGAYLSGIREACKIIESE